MFAEASALTEPAVSPDGQRFDLRCVKQSHSPDMFFLPPVDCDGGFVGVRSKKPKTVVVLVCRVGAEADAPVLVFAPGQVLERVYEDNDCTLSEGHQRALSSARGRHAQRAEGLGGGHHHHSVVGRLR